MKLSEADSLSSKKGVYKSKVWFPKSLFNSGIYYFSIGFVDIEFSRLHFYSQNTISIEVIEDINARGFTYTGAIGGVVRPKLEWNTEKC